MAATPLKTLKPVDITLPSNIIKGAVVLHRPLVEWMPEFEHRHHACLLQVDLLKEELPNIVSRARVAFEVSEDCEDSFGVLDENGSYLNSSSLRSLQHGFTIYFTFSPDSLVRRVWSDRTREGVGMEATLRKIAPFARQFVVLSALQKQGVIQHIFHMFNDEDTMSDLGIRCVLLECVCGLLSAGLEWNRLPPSVFALVASLMKAPSQDMLDRDDSLAHVFKLLTLAVSSNDVDVCGRALCLVDLPSLAPIVSHKPEHAMACLNLLRLFNVVYDASSDAAKGDIVRFTSGHAFRQAVILASMQVDAGHEGIKHELLSLVTLRFIPYREASVSTCTHSTIRRILELPFIRDDDDARDEWAAYLREEEGSALVATFLLFMNDTHGDKMPQWMMENNSRGTISSCFAWKLMALVVNLSETVRKLFPIDCEEDDALSSEAALLLLQLSVQENPCERLFCALFEKAQSMWRDMNAREDEERKVCVVLRDLALRALRLEKITTFDQLQRGLEGRMTYKMLVDEWEREAEKKEQAFQQTELVQGMKKNLRGRIRTLVTHKRIQALKEGFAFCVLHKGKMNRDHLQMWKLDSYGNYITIRDMDSMELIEKVPVRDITFAIGQEKWKDSWGVIRMVVNERFVECATEDEVAYRAWMDGINSLNAHSHSKLSEEVKEEVERLLSMEIRVRLDRCTPRELGPLPPLPTNWDWVTKSCSKSFETVSAAPSPSRPSTQFDHLLWPREKFAPSHLYFNNRRD